MAGLATVSFPGAQPDRSGAGEEKGAIDERFWRFATSGSTASTDDLTCSGASSGVTLGNRTTLDCDGHSILGNAAAQGEGPGIIVQTNITVMNCTVKYFDAGIYLNDNGRNNVINNNTVEDDVGGGNFGDGIAVSISSNNQITDNTVKGNGPYDGIGMVGKSTGNAAAGTPPQAYDLWDYHFQCDQNTWSGNTWGTKKPACVA